MVAIKVRLRFAKTGLVRLVSHHDLMRCLERAVRRADLAVAQTQGFSPRPKLTFPLALGLGIEGRREVLEIELARALEPADVRDRLAAVLPPGFEIFEPEAIPLGKSPLPCAALYSLPIPPDGRGEIQAALSNFHAQQSWIYTRIRPDRTTEFDLRPEVLSAIIDEKDTLRFTLRVNADGSARPEEFLRAIGIDRLVDEGAILTRDDVWFARPSVAPAQPTEARAGNLNQPGESIEHEFDEITRT